jgi:hypothetical protein
MEDFREHVSAAQIPSDCPYTIDQVLADDWYPEPPEQPK